MQLKTMLPFKDNHANTLASFSFGSSEPYRGTIFLLRFVALQPFQLTTKCKDASVTKKENSFENIK